VNPLNVLPIAVVLLADFCVAFLVVLFADCSRLPMSLLSFHRGHLLHLFQVLLQGIDVL